jgi:NADPH:quinone reductase-like Zn-dependent oxidoreductase
MRAAVLTEHGLPTPGEWDEPVAGPGQAVVEVAAAGVNPVDVSKAAGLFYTGNAPIPSVAGSEGVGSLPDGRRVYFGVAIPPFGSIAERTLIEPAAAYDVPDALDDGLAVALGIAGLAARLALERGGLGAGEHVLVLGASGSVGQFAVQLARLMGAGRVIAAARSESALERSIRQGADAAVNLADADLTERFKQAGEGRVDLVIDPLWGEPAVAALRATAPHGRLVQLGESAGAEATIAAADVRGAGRAILGHSNFVVDGAVKRETYRRLAEHAVAGEIELEIERLPLERVTEAFERQKQSPGHKLVIVP